MGNYGRQAGTFGHIGSSASLRLVAPCGTICTATSFASAPVSLRTLWMSPQPKSVKLSPVLYVSNVQSSWYTVSVPSVSGLHHRQRPAVTRSQPCQRSSIIENTAFLHHFPSAIQRTKPVRPSPKPIVTSRS
jgi:hypothetical protein